MDSLAFHGLETEPFSNAPVSRFYFDSSQHAQALTRLRYAMGAMKGLAVCVGEVGAGKTTLARRLLDVLDDQEFEAALLVILHRDITAEWLLRRVAFQLGVEAPSKDKLVLLSQLYRRLLQIHESGRKAVVLIDEAQMLETRDLMEEFRGLLNLEVPDRKLLSFVFFGLPELENNLRLDPPLLQRVALRVMLQPLDRSGTEAYVQHRLRMAGAEHEIFEPDAIELLHRASRGVPRLINTIADNALLESAILGARNVTPQLMLAVVENLGVAPHLTPAMDDGPDTSPRTEVDVALDEIDKVLAQLDGMG